MRTLISNLRVGANWRSVIPGLARAFVAHEKGSKASKAEMDAASAKVSEAFHLCPNLGVLIPALMEGGLEELERRCTLKAGKTQLFHIWFLGLHADWLGDNLAFSHDSQQCRKIKGSWA